MANQKVTKGQGYWQKGNDEIFNFGKDWLLWNWEHKQGHWFSGKRNAMRFTKMAQVSN